MAWIELAVQPVVRAGLDPTMVTAAYTDGNSFSNNGKTWVEILNLTGATTLTIDTPNTVDGEAIANPTVSIGANTRYKVGPFPPDVYNRSDDSVRVSVTSIDSVTIAALTL